MIKIKEKYGGTPEKEIIVGTSPGQLIKSRDSKLEKVLLDESVGEYNTHWNLKRISLGKRSDGYDLTLDYGQREFRDNKTPKLDEYSFYWAKVDNGSGVILLDFNSPNGHEYGFDAACLGARYPRVRFGGTKLLKILNKDENPALECGTAVSSCLMGLHKWLYESREDLRQELEKELLGNMGEPHRTNYRNRLNNLVSDSTLEKIRTTALQLSTDEPSSGEARRE